jgi:ABC-2 type transport system permease protein
MTATGHRQPQAPKVRPGPQLGPVFLAEYRLLLRSVCTIGRLVAIGLLAALSVLTAITVAIGSPSDPISEGVGFVNGNIATLIPVAVLVFGAAVLGDLIDDGSLVYLWLRPVPSWVHVLAAWAATVTVVVPLVLVPVVLATAIIDTSPELLGAAVLGGLVAVAGYAGLFVTLGVRFKRALPWGLIYILIWEGFVASAGKTATKLALRSYVRSILSSMTDVTLKLGEFSLVTGIVVPLVVGALALLYASRRLAKTDVA